MNVYNICWLCWWNYSARYIVLMHDTAEKFAMVLLQKTNGGMRDERRATRGIWPRERRASTAEGRVLLKGEYCWRASTADGRVLLKGARAQGERTKRRREWVAAGGIGRGGRGWRVDATGKTESLLNIWILWLNIYDCEQLDTERCNLAYRLWI